MKQFTIISLINSLKHVNVHHNDTLYVSIVKTNWKNPTHILWVIKYITLKVNISYSKIGENRTSTIIIIIIVKN